MLKNAVEKKINADFASEGRVSISSIYDIAKSKPFGLMPCNITAFILGFVLREYTSDQYRYTDDQTSDVMNVVHLQVMIDEIIKKSVGQTLSLMRPPSHGLIARPADATLIINL